MIIIIIIGLTATFYIVNMAACWTSFVFLYFLLHLAQSRDHVACLTYKRPVVSAYVLHFFIIIICIL